MRAAAAVERLAGLGEALPQQLVGLLVDPAHGAPLVEDRLEAVARLLPLRGLDGQRLGLRGERLLARHGRRPGRVPLGALGPDGLLGPHDDAVEQAGQARDVADDVGLAQALAQGARARQRLPGIAAARLEPGGQQLDLGEHVVEPARVVREPFLGLAGLPAADRPLAVGRAHVDGAVGVHAAPPRGLGARRGHGVDGRGGRGHGNGVVAGVRVVRDGARGGLVVLGLVRDGLGDRGRLGGAGRTRADGSGRDRPRRRRARRRRPARPRGPPVARDLACAAPRPAGVPGGGPGRAAAARATSAGVVLVHDGRLACVPAAVGSAACRLAAVRLLGGSGRRRSADGVLLRGVLPAASCSGITGAAGAGSAVGVRHDVGAAGAVRRARRSDTVRRPGPRSGPGTRPGPTRTGPTRSSPSSGPP